MHSDLARSFARFGWIGFWLQLAVGAIPVALLIYSILLGSRGPIGTRATLVLIEMLTLISLLVLTFTTIWFYRYTRLARSTSAGDRGEAALSFRRAAWIGVAASTIGIVFSALVMIFEVSQLLLYFLRAPQAGVPVVQTTAGGPTSWVSASDMLSLMGLIVTMLVEIFVLALSLWLLFRATAEFGQTHSAGHDQR